MEKKLNQKGIDLIREIVEVSVEIDDMLSQVENSTEE